MSTKDMKLIKNTGAIAMMISPFAFLFGAEIGSVLFFLFFLGGLVFVVAGRMAE